jgi:hypothetical protein
MTNSELDNYGNDDWNRLGAIAFLIGLILERDLHGCSNEELLKLTEAEDHELYAPVAGWAQELGIDDEICVERISYEHIRGRAREELVRRGILVRAKLRDIH